MKLSLLVSSVTCTQFAITYYYRTPANLYTLQTRIYTKEGSRLNGTTSCNYIDDGEWLCEGKNCKQPPLASLDYISNFGRETWSTGLRSYWPDH
ncbi:hypothetical protein CONCODRAFT_9354, partial [Conidiobolus coronatus NRRL 28638]